MALLFIVTLHIKVIILMEELIEKILWTLIVTNFGKLNFAEVINVLTRLPERNALIKDLIQKSPGGHILVLTDRREHAMWLRDNLEGSAL